MLLQRIHANVTLSYTTEHHFQKKVMLDTITMAKFYVIGTPIGNLQDITLRALETLKSVDIILCEDTRATRTLLSRHGIAAKTVSYHAHSTPEKSDAILNLFREGKNIALVSDAGTPGISDPGCLLVAQVRAAFGDEVEIISIPGPSAVTAALSISGLPSSEFLFLGFLPHKKGRQTLFQEIAATTRTVVFYESPHRIEKAIDSLIQYSPERKVVIGRELTKVFEQIISGTPAEIKTYFSTHPDKIRGEFVVMIGFF